MSKTIHYKTLIKNINLLKSCTLPAQNPAGSYSPQELLQIRAFRILAHAELESYIENICRDVCDATKSNSNAKNNSRVESSIISYHSIAQEKKHTANITPKSAYDYYRNIINKNHGIKEKNLFSLFIPIGIDIEKIDSTLLASLENYGETRGKIAHNAISHSAAGLMLHMDPSVESTEITNIVHALRVVDLNVRRLLR